MKKTSQNKIQSSVPVQHSHTTAPAAATAQPAAPAPVGQSGTDKTDNRERTGNLPPIDPEARKKNRTLPTQTVVQRLTGLTNREPYWSE